MLPTVDNGRDISNEIDSDTSPSKNCFHEDDEFNDESYDVIKVGEEAKVDLTVENATIDDTEDILDAQDIPISEISEVIPKQNTSSFDDDDEVIEDIECSKNSNNASPNALHEPKIADEHLKEALFQHQQDLNKAEPNKPRPKSGRPRKQTKQTITKIKNDSIMPANRKRQSEDKLKNITKKTKNDDSDFAFQPTVVLSKHNAKQIQKKINVGSKSWTDISTIENILKNNTHVTDTQVDPLQTENDRVSEENNENDSFGNQEVQIIGQINNSSRIDIPRLSNNFVMGVWSYLGDYKTKEGRLAAMNIKKENIIM